NYQPSNLWCNYEGMAAPSTLISWIPSTYLVRNYLTPQDTRDSEAKLDSCWYAAWANQRTVTDSKGKKTLYGKLAVTVYVRYQNQMISTYFYKGDEEQFGTCAPNPAEPDACFVHDADEMVTDNWTSGRNYKSLLETNGSPVTLTASEEQARANLLAQVTNEV